MRLLHRTTRQTHLTEAGSRYVERCKRLLAGIEDANASVSDLGRSLAGPITMTAPILFWQMHVVPVVTEFLVEHSAASVNLILTDRFANIVEEGIRPRRAHRQFAGFRVGSAAAGDGAPSDLRITRISRAAWHTQVAR